MKIKKIAVTGSAGQIAYNLLFRIAAGELLGVDQPIALHLLDLPETARVLESVAMELEDCAFPLLKSIVVGTDPNVVFRDVNYAFLVGAKPRGPGMERKELLKENGLIFHHQGKALNDVAAKGVLTLVVGNPCNTNCLIALKAAPKIPPSHFFAMMRLDENRAKSMLASKAGVGVDLISNVTIWGNHSARQAPDFLNGKIGNRNIVDVIKDRLWLETEFVPAVQNRGAKVIEMRGKSSAASAANAALGAMKAVINPTPEREWFSHAIYSRHNPYGVPDDLVFSFPCRSLGHGQVEIVPNLVWDEFLDAQIQSSIQELAEERKMIQGLI